jgi:hypothetical protein
MQDGDIFDEAIRDGKEYRSEFRVNAGARYVRYVGDPAFSIC